jgi:hypothetical protein
MTRHNTVVRWCSGWIAWWPSMTDERPMKKERGWGGGAPGIGSPSL